METVFITGASRGIGLELSRQFLQAGYKVIATYRGEPSADLAALQSQGTVVLRELDVRHDDSVSSLKQAFSDETIDIVINNAGVIGPKDNLQDGISAELWLDTFAINCIAPINISHALLDNLKRAKNPRIITVSSQMGSMSLVSSGMPVYRTTKAALNKAMQQLALELKTDNVVVCPIHPGWVRTDMGGSNADLSAEESAQGIFTFAQNLTMQSSGQFFIWDGSTHEW